MSQSYEEPFQINVCQAVLPVPKDPNIPSPFLITHHELRTKSHTTSEVSTALLLLCVGEIVQDQRLDTDQMGQKTFFT